MHIWFMVKDEIYHVIGLMSGTSLDGLDIAYCTFKNVGKKWSYNFISCTTIDYPVELKSKLSNCINYSPIELEKLDVELGDFIGEKVNQFIQENSFSIDYISSHGHTVFHQPEKGITLQIGNGKRIKDITGITTIYDFRTLDVYLGGQGAPLVPIGDLMLFSEYNYCLNLGGISNVSFDDEGERVAFDISPCNIISNHYASQLGLEYDHNGDIGRKGNVNDQLLKKLDNINYYKQSIPKSIGKELIINDFIPLIDSFDISIEDKMATFYEHISSQLAKTLKKGKVLVSGGGAYNNYLIDLLKNKTEAKVFIPDDLLISFKEALIFAFLGLLKIKREINILNSYTGASKNSSSGKIVS